MRASVYRMAAGWVRIERTEVPLAVDERIAQAPILRHAHHGIIDAAVAVGVEFAQHLPDDPRAFLVRPRTGHTQFLHAIEHPTVHRLQPIAHVRQRPADDHRHRIIDVGGAHLVLDVDRDYPFSFCHFFLIGGSARTLSGPPLKREPESTLLHHDHRPLFSTIRTLPCGKNENLSRIALQRPVAWPPARPPRLSWA
jgi:hypothetical protein